MLMVNCLISDKIQYDNNFSDSVGNYFAVW